jgi:aminoglycoside phosphotransferase (APT) family kinase protein
LAPAGVTALRPLTGGASSLTYAAECAGRPVVVKVAPAGVAPTGHRDVLRQARIIRALGPTGVPVPEVVFEDAGQPPAVPPLFAMTMLPGDSVEPLFDDVEQLAESIVTQRFRNAAATLAALHRLAPDALALGAEPVVGAAAEVDRWCATLQTVDQTLVPGWPDTAAALRATVPAPFGPGVVHGDFRLGNLLAVDAQITAVIDWEIWTLGDPRIDLGWFLVNADPGTYRRPTAYRDAVPTVESLAADYGATLPGVRWFMGLACFKSAATWSLIVKHNRRRPQPRADLEAMAPALPALLERARSHLR